MALLGVSVAQFDCDPVWDAATLARPYDDAVTYPALQLGCAIIRVV